MSESDPILNDQEIDGYAWEAAGECARLSVLAKHVGELRSTRENIYAQLRLQLRAHRELLIRKAPEGTSEPTA